jgi:hypothetical protein
MPKSNRSSRRDKQRPQALEIVWECSPNVDAQAQAILAFLGLDSGGMCSKPRSGWQSRKRWG